MMDVSLDSTSDHQHVTLHFSGDEHTSTQTNKHQLDVSTPLLPSTPDSTPPDIQGAYHLGTNQSQLTSHIHSPASSHTTPCTPLQLLDRRALQVSVLTLKVQILHHYPQVVV